MLIGLEHLLEINPVRFVRPSVRDRAVAIELLVFDASDGIGEMRLVGGSSVGDGKERRYKSSGECKLNHFV